MKKFVVIGLGQFGSSIARTLAAAGADILAIDINEANTEAIKDEVSTVVAFDSTDMRLLKQHNVTDADAVVVAIGEDFESLLLTAAQLQDLGMDNQKIIVRAANNQQRRILQKMGIQEIWSPEDEVGRTVAEMLLQPSLKSFLRLPDNYEIVELEAPRRIIGKSLLELSLRKYYNINLITIRRKFTEMVKGESTEVEHMMLPTGGTTIEDNDLMFIFGTKDDVTRFIEVNL